MYSHVLGQEYYFIKKGYIINRACKKKKEKRIIMFYVVYNLLKRYTIFAFIVI